MLHYKKGDRVQAWSFYHGRWVRAYITYPYSCGDYGVNLETQGRHIPCTRSAQYVRPFYACVVVGNELRLVGSNYD